MKGDRESIWTAVAIVAFILATIVVVLWAPVWLGDLAGFVETGQLPPDDSDIRVIR